MPAKSYSKRQISSTGFGARDTWTHHLGVISSVLLFFPVMWKNHTSLVGLGWELEIMPKNAKLKPGSALGRWQTRCLCLSVSSGGVCCVERKRRREADSLAICGNPFLTLLIYSAAQVLSLDFLLLTFLSGRQSLGWRPRHGPSLVGQQVLFPLSPL